MNGENPDLRDRIFNGELVVVNEDEHFASPAKHLRFKKHSDPNIFSVSELP